MKSSKSPSTGYPENSTPAKKNDRPPTRYHLVEYSSYDFLIQLIGSINEFQHFQTNLNLDAFLPELDKLFSVNLDSSARLQLVYNHDHQVQLSFLYLLCYLDLTCVPPQQTGDISRRQMRSAMKRATQNYQQFVSLATDILVQDPDSTLIMDLLNFYDYLLTTRFDTIPASSGNLRKISITSLIHPFTINLLDKLCATVTNENLAVLLIQNQNLPVNIRSDLVRVVDSYHIKKSLLTHPLSDPIFRALIDRIDNEDLLYSVITKFFRFSGISNTKMVDVVQNLSTQKSLHAIASTSGYSSHVGSEAAYRLFDTNLLANLIYESPYAKVRKLVRKLLQYPTTGNTLLFNARYIFPRCSVVIRNQATLSQLMDLIRQLIPVVDKTPDYFSHLRNFLFKIYEGSYLVELVADLPAMIAPGSELAQKILDIIISKTSVDDAAFFKKQALAPYNADNLKLRALDRLFKTNREIFYDLILTEQVPDKIFICLRYFQSLSDEDIIIQLLVEHGDKLSHQIKMELSTNIVTPKWVAQFRLDPDLQFYIGHTNLGREY